MSVVVSLQAVVQELEGVSNDILAYLHRPTGELLSLSREELSAAEDEEDLTSYPDWQQEALRLAQNVLDSEAAKW